MLQSVKNFFTDMLSIKEQSSTTKELLNMVEAYAQQPEEQHLLLLNILVKTKELDIPVDVNEISRVSLRLPFNNQTSLFEKAYQTCMGEIDVSMLNSLSYNLRTVNLYNFLEIERKGSEDAYNDFLEKSITFWHYYCSNDIRASDVIIRKLAIASFATINANLKSLGV